MNMKKITKLLCVAALLLAGMGGVIPAKATKLYATYGTPASEGKWNVETNTYTWTKSNSNLMTIFTFSNGELAQYKSLHLTTSDFTSSYRVCFMNGSTAVATIGFYSAGEKNLVLSERTETKDLDLTTITHISFGGNTDSGSIGLTNVYLQKPTSISFDDTGTAIIGLTDILYDSNLTFDDQTGEMTSNGQGTFSLNLDSEDFSNVSRIELLRSGDDIVQTLQVTDAVNGVLNTWWGSKYSCDFTNYKANASKVTKLAWNCATAGTMTITGIKLTGSVITATPGGEVSIGSLPRKYYDNGEWKTGTLTTSYGVNIQTALGDGSAIQDEYVDIANYKMLRLYISSGDPRLFLVKEENFTPTADGYILTKDGVKQNGQWNGVQDTDHKLVKNGDYYYISVEDIKAACGGQAKLICVKAEYNQSIDISNIVVTEDSDYGYNLSGAGAFAPSALTALADKSATAIDATGVTKAVALTTANPNCLITANEGIVTNAQNVIVDGTCANLVLTDGYPFKAPVAFTATTASYATNINAEAGAGTLCLPFAAAIPEGVTAYTLAYTSGDKATAKAVENTIPANTPVLLNGSGEATFTGAAAAVAATANNAADALTGVFEKTKVAQGSYVLQNLDGGIGFYKVASDDIYVNPFRAYLTAQASGSRIAISFDNVATGIQTVAAQQGDDAVYDLQGRRVSAPTKGLYIVGGKKVMMK